MSALDAWATSYEAKTGSTFTEGIKSVGQGLGTAAAAGSVAIAGMAATQIYDAVTKARDFRGMLASPFNSDLHEMYRAQPKQFNAAFTSLRNMNPEFSKDPMVGGNYMRRMMTFAARDPGMAAGPLLESMGHQSRTPSLMHELARAGSEAASGSFLEAQRERRDDKKQKQDYEQRVQLEHLKHDLGQRGSAQQGEMQHRRQLALENYKATLQSVRDRGNQKVDDDGNPSGKGDQTFRDWYNKQMNAGGLGAVGAHQSAADDHFMRHQLTGLHGQKSGDPRHPLAGIHSQY